MSILGIAAMVLARYLLVWYLNPQGTPDWGFLVLYRVLHRILTCWWFKTNGSSVEKSVRFLYYSRVRVG